MSLRWSQSELQAAVTKIGKPKNKYGAKRVQVDNIWFDSKAEAQRYHELKLMQQAGLIADLNVHPMFPIVYIHQQICVVELDFGYVDERGRVYEDVKGKDNPLSALKRKLVEAFYSIKVDVIR